MIKIEIKEATKERREITSKKDCKLMVFYDQQAYAHTLDKNGTPRAYPESCKIGLDADQQPYGPGFYTLDPVSIYVDRFGQLALSRPKLRALAASQAAKAA